MYFLFSLNHQFSVRRNFVIFPNFPLLLLMLVRTGFPRPAMSTQRRFVPSCQPSQHFPLSSRAPAQARALQGTPCRQCGLPWSPPSGSNPACSLLAVNLEQIPFCSHPVGTNIAERESVSPAACNGQSYIRVSAQLLKSLGL